MLIIGSTVQQMASANDCPKYRFAKKYLSKASTSPISEGNINQTEAPILKIKRLTYNEYVVMSSYGGDFLITEECGKVAWETTGNPITFLDDGTMTEGTNTCEGFLKSNKSVFATCVLSYLDPRILEEFSEAITLKWRPLK